MTYYTATELRQQAGSLTASAAQSELSRLSKSATGNYDVFLSHSFSDALLILGLKRTLEADGLTVYVDWLEDPQLDRRSVNATTAAHLREQMKRCKSLVYATSQNASTSRWMPWELGFFDGTHGPEKVAICPITTGTGTYTGEEYLGLYKTLEKVRDAGVLRPFVVRQSGRQAERLGSFAAGRGTYVGLS
ncbi:TIR domain-containing protein [Nocardioides sp. Root140]|uniref:TIR domain-containing protein n=1 Tax=Nocardioides sp. Root140 TaxID=1736460 RepID=UPI000701C41A|nr:TIR domain-containing protein [Nocardioides sp. Root140]KQY61831.1 hypothetical protein ASD30_25145 [Nocardioides sp. Root140]